MEEEEALRSYCRRMISLLRSKQQQQERRRHTHKGARSEGAECDTHVAVRGCSKPEGGRTSPGMKTRPSPETRPVPAQLVSTLRIKTLSENMRRAAEVELHKPGVCGVCERDQASLALGSFIRRKKTQLRFQTLMGRLNTHLCSEVCPHWGNLCKFSQSPSTMPHTGFGRNYSVDLCGSQQPWVALETTKEHGVALATDEMRVTLTKTL